MKKSLSTSICLFLFWTQLYSQLNQDIIWSKSYGGSLYEEASKIECTNDGGYIIVGVTPSNDHDVSDNHGLDDGWIVKLDAEGLLEWQRCYGGSNYDNIRAIRQTTDGGFIFCGATSSNDGDIIGDHYPGDAWIVKIDSLGIIQWQKFYGGTAVDGFNDMLVLSQGYLFVGGTESGDGDINFNHGSSDVWIVSVDDTGKIIWEKTYGGSNFDDGLAALLTPNGIVVAADTDSPDDDLSNSNYHGETDYWVLKIDTLGNIKWSKCFGGSVNDDIESISKLIDGGYAVGGYTYSIDGEVSGKHGLRDYWVIKIDSGGSLKWQKCLGGTNEDICHSVIVTNDNGIIATGTTLSNDGDVSFIHDPNGDAWIVKLDSSGNLVWQYSFGGTKGDGGDELIQIADGSYVFCGGSFSSDGDLSGNTNHGSSDYWVAKLSPSTYISPSISDSFRVYPIPSSGEIYLERKSGFTGKIILINTIGLQVYSNSYLAQTIIEINLNQLANGVYLMEIENGNMTVIKKIVIVSL